MPAISLATADSLTLDRQLMPKAEEVPCRTPPLYEIEVTVSNLTVHPRFNLSSLFILLECNISFHYQCTCMNSTII